VARDLGKRGTSLFGGTMNKNDFETAVGEAAQDAVWKTPHPLTHHLADDDQRREQYLREYQLSVGRQVLAVIENLRPAVRFYCLGCPFNAPPSD
jgi:hypothetical protein